MSTGVRFDYDIAKKVADKLVTTLAPACDRIEIAGSLRRGTDTVGDIELVCIPSFVHRRVGGPAAPLQLGLFPEPQQQPLFERDLAGTELVSHLDETLEQLVADGAVSRQVPTNWESKPAWGARLKRVWLRVSDELGLIQVEIYITTPTSWGAILAIRTGPGDFSKALVTYVATRTPYKHDAGMLIDKRSGVAIPVPTEQHYFATVGLPWWPPDQRTARTLRYTMERQEA